MTVDGHRFFVSTSHDVQRRLVELRRRLQAIVDYTSARNYPDAKRSARLKRRWRRTIIGDTMASDPEAAYVLNGGSELRLCMKSMNDGNTMMYVGIHELSHLMTQRWRSHGDDFSENMRLLLDVAIDIGVYTYTDYGSSPQNVCGTWL